MGADMAGRGLDMDKARTCRESRETWGAGGGRRGQYMRVPKHLGLPIWNRQPLLYCKVISFATSVCRCHDAEFYQY